MIYNMLERINSISISISPFIDETLSSHTFLHLFLSAIIALAP